MEGTAPAVLSLGITAERECAMFEDENWIAESGHPATKMLYETAEIGKRESDPHFVPGTFARVTVDDVVVFGPVRNTGDALREYNRRYVEFVEKLENAQ